MNLSLTPPEAPGSRPRVEGDREQQILEAALEVLADVGYDRLTMDAVAAGAHASKATLYRRWNSKAELAIEALCAYKGEHEIPDTGELRGDLMAAFCGMGEGDGLVNQKMIEILASVMTAVARDHEFAEHFRSQFIAPKAVITETIFARALARGEARPDLDVELIAPALPGIVMHRALILGLLPDAAFITRVIDEIILPAAGVGQVHTTLPVPPTLPDSKDHS